MSEYLDSEAISLAVLCPFQAPCRHILCQSSGDSMINAGIFPDDILIVDRSLDPVDKKIVIAVLDGELMVKRLRLKSGVPFKIIHLISVNFNTP